jgi:alpha-beta hydrolase superfamily lysophospholipase
MLDDGADDDDASFGEKGKDFHQLNVFVAGSSLGSVLMLSFLYTKDGHAAGALVLLASSDEETTEALLLLLSGLLSW